MKLQFCTVPPQSRQDFLKIETEIVTEMSVHVSVPLAQE